MTSRTVWKLAGAVLLLYAATEIASAQTFTSLFSFDGAHGANPFTTLTQGLTGDLYGTTGNGGDLSCDAPYGCGTLFRITQNGQLTTLHNFGEMDGAGANELVLATDRNFYGTTGAGGDRNCNPPYGCGTVFRWGHDGTFAVLHTFEEANGGNPTAGLVQAADGNLYGTTFGVQPYGLGTVFKVTRQGTFTTIYTFCADLRDCNDGSNPVGALVQGDDGQLYGTTSAGGRVNRRCTIGCGTIFTVTRNGKLRTLHRFQYGEGESPQSGLVQGADGDLYGTTAVGGANGDGTVFKIDQAGILTVLHTFSRADGDEPEASLIQATDGNFYGTTKEGGSGTHDGTIFQVTPDGSFTTLYQFCNPGCTDGGFVWSGLLQSTNGVFYGTTAAGGLPQGYGTVYSFDMGLRPFITFVRNSGRIGQSGGILGQGFAGATGVLLNGTPVTFTVVSDTYIRGTVPPGATTGYVTVTTPSGTLTSNVPFHVIP